RARRLDGHPWLHQLTPPANDNGWDRCRSSDTNPTRLFPARLGKMAGLSVVSEFDAAAAAVQAALDAGASYADARVMHRRIESMDARNGEIEELNQYEDSGLGVRALVGSGWGFFAIPDLSDAAARRAGERAAAIAAASAGVPGPTTGRVPAPVVSGSWASPCEVDPLSVPLSEKGDLLVSVTATMKRAGADHAEA